jgi:hypothetical protein
MASETPYHHRSNSGRLGIPSEQKLYSELKVARSAIAPTIAGNLPEGAACETGIRISVFRRVRGIECFCAELKPEKVRHEIVMARKPADIEPRMEGGYLDWPSLDFHATPLSTRFCQKAF